MGFGKTGGARKRVSETLVDAAQRPLPSFNAGELAISDFAIEKLEIDVNRSGFRLADWMVAATGKMTIFGAHDVSNIVCALGGLRCHD